MITTAHVNAMSVADFVKAFGDVAEHSAWVAEMAAHSRPYASREHMFTAFTNALRSAPREKQTAVIRAHPDLATKAKLTQDSSREQEGAGLSALTHNEFNRFSHLNDGYKARFGFPFIFAVRGATKQQILAAFEQRIANTPEQEFATAIAQINRIMRFRLEDRIASP